MKYKHPIFEPNIIEIIESEEDVINRNFVIRADYSTGYIWSSLVDRRHYLLGMRDDETNWAIGCQFNFRAPEEETLSYKDVLAIEEGVMHLRVTKDKITELYKRGYFHVLEYMVLNKKLTNIDKLDMITDKQRINLNKKIEEIQNGFKYRN